MTGKKAGSAPQNVTTVTPTQTEFTVGNNPLQQDTPDDIISDTAARVQRARQMESEGATASQIFAETGLVRTASGTLQDGFAVPFWGV